MGRTSLVKHSIDTGGSYPIRQHPRRVPFSMTKEVDEEIEKMLMKGVIEPSNNPWASPVVLVKKKCGALRFCVDYRRLNEVTRKDDILYPELTR